VILTVRDPESWWRSAEATVHASLRSNELADSPLSRMNAKAKTYRKQHGGAPDVVGLDHDAAIAEFNRHNEEVRRVIPPERLLVFEVKQGWTPLCKFLGVPVPATPFPLTNTTDDYQALVRNLTAQGKPS
jgi:hypothetical protein